MSKTLADMSAEERAECVGMWADTTRQGLGVVVNATEPSDCWVLFPEGGGRVATCHSQRVTPRFDLPRAWTPDGEPVPGEWEEGHVDVSYDEPDPGILKDPVRIEGLSEGGMSYYEEPPNGIVVELDRFGEGEGKARRWVGEWEQDNE